MKRVYQIPTDDTQVSIKVKVGTVGVAYTAVFNARTGGQRKLVAESTLASAGSINKKKAGEAEMLEDSYLIIPTLIDFAGLPKSNLKSAAENIYIRYTLYGGISGTLEFDYDLDDVVISASGRMVSINKPIQLK